MYFDQKHFGNFLNVFGFGQEYSTSLSKMQSTFPYERLMIFFWKSYISFQHFQNIGKRLSNFWRKNVGKLVKHAIWMSEGKFREKTTFLEKKLNVPLHRVWTSGHTFSELWRQYSSTFFQTAFYLSKGGVWEKLFIWESKIKFQFLKLKINQVFCRKKNRIVKTAL